MYIGNFSALIFEQVTVLIQWFVMILIVLQMFLIQGSAIHVLVCSHLSAADKHLGVAFTLPDKHELSKW